jgi:putative ABC transport system permease protein
MLNPRWRKVLRDLWLYKMRTVVVVLSIAVGVFAVGTIATSQIVLSRDLQQMHLATNPASATIFTFESFGEDVVEAIGNISGVEKAEGRRHVSMRIKTGPEEWRILYLAAIADFDDVEIDRFSHEAGQWPPEDHEILIERAALKLANAQVGDTIIVKPPDGKEREMNIVGLAHDINAQMYVFDGVVYGYTTTDTLEWLGQSDGFNELRLIVSDDKFDIEHIRATANKARDKIEAAGQTVLFTLIPEPGKPMLDYLIQAISALMGALAMLSLLLSGFLVINTISALLAQQTRQIGMMKAVGARTGQLITMYLTTVIIFGLLALLIAVPLGMVGAFYFSRFIAGFLNFDVTTFRLPPEVLLAEIVVGIVVPLVAGLFPIFAGVRVTVREAVSEYGLGRGQFGSSIIDRVLLKIQNSRFSRRYLSRPLLLSIRNTFRRKTRLGLTLLTLTLGGAIFITVFSVRASMLGTLDEWLDYFGYDVAVQFERGYRIERIIRETHSIPGIVDAETWGFYNTRRVRPDGNDSDNIILFAPPADTKLVNPIITEGRWLTIEDENALVVNTIFLRDEPDVNLGDEVLLKIDGRDEPFTLVGIATGGMPMASAFINYPYYARTSGNVGRAEWMFATTKQHTLAYQSKVVKDLEDHFEYIGLNVSAVAKVTEERAEVEAIFEVIIVLLLIMAILLAVIGGLGLMGTMSINVLERTREIGVIRAIGASDISVLRVFITEGILIGLISWVIGVVLAFPVSQWLSEIVGQRFLYSSLSHTFSISGAVLWLVVVVFLSALASFIPAWSATRITVREVLAYE